MNPIVESLLFRSAIIFLMVGSVAGLAAGVLLLWQPDRLRTLSEVLNRWISTRHLDTALEQTISFDPWFYRHRHMCGALTLLASLYIVYFFTMSLDRAIAISELARKFTMNPAAIGMLLDTLVISALLAALLAAFVSVFLLVRPSLLRDFEQGANRWISLRRALKPLEIPRPGLDGLVFKHGRRAGILLVLGSVYTLTLLTYGLSFIR